MTEQECSSCFVLANVSIMTVCLFFLFNGHSHYSHIWWINILLLFSYRKQQLNNIQKSLSESIKPNTIYKCDVVLFGFFCSGGGGGGVCLIVFRNTGTKKGNMKSETVFVPKSTESFHCL